MTLNFYIRFNTKFGQIIYVSGNTAALGNNDSNKAIPLQYINDQLCHCQVEISADTVNAGSIDYRYILKEGKDIEVIEWKDGKSIDFHQKHIANITLLDTWNHAGTIENAFYTKPFKEVFLKQDSVQQNKKKIANASHEFKVKCPLLKEDEVLFLTGS